MSRRHKLLWPRQQTPGPSGGAAGLARPAPSQAVIAKSWSLLHHLLIAAVIATVMAITAVSVAMAMAISAEAITIIIIKWCWSYCCSSLMRCCLWYWSVAADADSALYLNF